ncbi:MAG TPA: biopolymer transporter ExbD [Ferruginibacter sp.]|jgi:biopolymer transport protein ExbD|nr:biopolymer transporter ExbD [Ferruginibacter sp.]
MPKVKIPRKSTNIDMTAMCDVAFLLLSFFILATKQKPPEVLAVKTPTSVSAIAAPEKSILITLTKEGKVFLMLGDETKKNAIIDDFNTTRGLQLTPAELQKLKRSEYIGLPVNKLKSALNMPEEIPANLMDGIPVDSSNNELSYWMRSVTNVYKGEDQNKLQQMILVKGDGEALYPVFKNVKDAFKANDIFKFRIVTEGEPVPEGSELYKTGVKK